MSDLDRGVGVDIEYAAPTNNLLYSLSEASGAVAVDRFSRKTEGKRKGVRLSDKHDPQQPNREVAD